VKDGIQLEDWQRQALLTQYQVLQQDSRSKASTHWTVVSIFIGINTALLGAVAYMLSNRSDNSQWIILILGLAFIGIFKCLCLWLNRVNFLLEMSKGKMQQIESLLNMVSDNILDTPEERKKKRRECKYFPCIPSDGALPVKGIYMVFSLLWLAAIIGAFIFN